MAAMVVGGNGGSPSLRYEFNWRLVSCSSLTVSQQSRFKSFKRISSLYCSNFASMSSSSLSLSSFALQPQQIRAPQHFRRQHHFHQQQHASVCQQFVQQPRSHRQLHFRVQNTLLKQQLNLDCVSCERLNGRRLPWVMALLLAPPPPPLLLMPFGVAFIVRDRAILFRCNSIVAEMVGIVSAILFVFFTFLLFIFAFFFGNSRMRLLSVRFSLLV